MLPQPKTRCKHQSTLFEKGQKAFQRGELPKTWWPQAMLNGWSFAGEIAYFQEMQMEYLPINDEPSYSESTQPYLY